jgi:hypothetical protein
MPASGVVDAVIGRYVLGWAHDPEDQNRRVELEVELDGQLVGEGIADIERGDLRANGIGDGRHAFRIELPDSLKPGHEHVLSVVSRQDRILLPLAGDFRVEFEQGVSGPAVVVHAEPQFDGTGMPGADLFAGADVGHALLGHDGWLFEVPDLELFERIVGRSRIARPAIQSWRARLLSAAERLGQSEVFYVVAAAPDKANIYGDHLPTETRPQVRGRAAELIAAGLRDENGVELLDLLPVLRDARRHGQLVPRAGTSLTWIGAFYAYRALAKELAKRFPSLTPMPLEALRLGLQIPVEPSLTARRRVALVGGELVSIVVGAEAAETEPDFLKDDLRAVYAPLPGGLEERLGDNASLLECRGAELSGHLLVVHEGSQARVASLLAEHFARTVIAVSGELPYEAIERESPVAVVQLLDEQTFCVD